MYTFEQILQASCAFKPLAEYQRYLFVGPHPDDIEYGCGALLSKLKGMGKDIVFAILTDGAAGTTDPSVTPEMMMLTREAETLKAAEFLGVSSVEFVRLEDGGSYTVDDAIRALAPVLLKHRPEIVFAPDPRLKTECHPDHIKTGEAVRRLTQIVPHPVSLQRNGVDVSGVKSFPPSPVLALYFTDDPNHFESVSAENMQEKMASLRLHASQMQGQEAEMTFVYFQMKAAACGAKVGTDFAEAYQVLPPTAQHVFHEGVHSFGM